VIDILIPTLGRHRSLQSLAANLINTTPQGVYRVLFVADESDTETRRVLDEFCFPGGIWGRIVFDGTYPCKINAALHHAHCRGDLVLPTADDVRFYEGWLEAVTAVFEDEAVQVVGTDDLSPATADRTHATMPVLRRSYIDAPGAVWGETGTVFHEGYRHNFCETELWQLASHRGVTAWADGAVIEHLHPAWGKRAEDATDEKGNKRGWEEDEVLFRSRQEEWRR
jgi:hypothetical protein